MSERWQPKQLSAVEDAGLNASTPRQQLWVDGWLVRLCPGKAKRARCVNALASGLLSLDERLDRVRALFDAARLELVVRVTPFSAPPTIDDELARRGFGRFDDTRVLVGCLATMPLQPDLPAGASLQPVDAVDFAAVVGRLRGTPDEQQQAHAQRLQHSPVPYEGWLLYGDGRVLACAQAAREAAHVGLYDVYTADEARNRGLATALCAALLRRARHGGATTAYLQVDAGNAPALGVYKKLGFADGYGYHYRARRPDRA